MANQGKRMVSEDQIKKLENLADIREAGENITIENGVISAAGGGTVQRYRHNICYNRDVSSEKRKLYAVVENTSSEPFTRTSFLKWIYDSGYTEGFKGYSAYAVVNNDTYIHISNIIYVSQDPGTTGNSFQTSTGFYYKKADQTISTTGIAIELTSTTFFDTIVAIN